MFPSKFEEEEDGLLFFLPVFPTPLLPFPLRESEDVPPPPLAAPGRFIFFFSLSLSLFNLRLRTQRSSSGPPPEREREREREREKREEARESGRKCVVLRWYAKFFEISIFRVSLKP